MDLEKHDGFWWPAGSRPEIRALIADTAVDAQWAVNFTDRQNVVVQAGGNVGCWPKWLAAKFRQVYTFEPEPQNFVAMLRNVPEPNVTKYPAALGENPGRVGLHLSPKNIGAHRVEGPGSIYMVKIDDLGLDECDLIILDVEGYELPALRGAEDTIDAYRPVIMVEDRGLGAKTRRGSHADIVKWLAMYHYREVHRVGYDVIFDTPRGPR